MINILIDENIPYASTFFNDIANVTVMPGREIQSKHIENQDALIIRSITPITQQLLSKVKNLPKFIGSCTAGIDHVDQTYLKKIGIYFTHAPGCNSQAVAEYVICAMLYLANKKKWDLRKQVLGIIGFGYIGKKLHKMSQNLGISTLICDPFIKNSNNHLCDLKTIIQNCDIISIHTPLTFHHTYPTHHLINEIYLKQFKKNASLINAARGAIVDNKALFNTLKQRNDLTVILDVWENEPEIHIGLMELVNIATPHIAGYSLNAKIKGLKKIVQDLANFFKIQIKPIPQPPKFTTNFADIKTNQLTQNALFKISKLIYDIEADSWKLKINIKHDNPSHFFDQMRKNYQARNEFKNYEFEV